MNRFLLFVFAIILSFTAISQNTTETKSEEEPILDFSDVEPQYPGGPEAMTEFIQANIVYPQNSIEKDEQGTVYVQFVVNLDGSIINVVILKGVSPALDAEAIRVIKLMPNWIPGEQKGKPVRVRYVIPINFMIQNGKVNDDDNKKKRRK